nr:uncharacterized protein LOC109149952 [Ipomoea trifida]
MVNPGATTFLDLAASYGIRGRSSVNDNLLRHKCDSLDLPPSFLQDGHYYVLSVSLKNRRFDIIDSSIDCKPDKVKYTNAQSTCCRPMQNMDLLAAFLDNKEQTIRTGLIRNMKPKRMQVVWHETSNLQEYEVCAMRHMESYIGQDPREWDCGLIRGGND